MTGVWITLSILVFLALLLLPSITLYVSITDKVDIRWGIYGMRFKMPESKVGERAEESVKKKHKKKKKSTQESDEEAAKKKPTEKTFSETVEFGINIAKAALRGLEGFLKHLRITDLKLCMLIATGDAAETALNYGKVYAAVYTLLGALDSFFTLKVKRIAIAPSFTADKSVYDIFFKMKLRIIFIIIAAFAALWVFIKPILTKDKGTEKRIVLRED